MNPETFEVKKDGKVIELTVREYELLKFFDVAKGSGIFKRRAFGKGLGL